MAKKVGIDFGTTNSTIAFFDQEDRLTFFAIIPERPSYYIPSTIFYPEKDLEAVIGYEARHMEARNIGGRRGDFYEFFKMFLPVKDSAQRKMVWDRRRLPREVTRDYLKRLLGEFNKQHGPIEEAVCSVPELWQRDLGDRANQLDANFGTEQLRKIASDELGLKAAQLCSEPVCAAAYYAYTKSCEGEAFTGNLLVCDPGGGTFDVSLCRVSKARIEVLTFEGYGYRGLDSAGVAFDRNIVKEINNAVGVSMDESSRDFRLFQWEVEEEKKLDYNNEAIEKVLSRVQDTMDTSDNLFLDDGAYDIVFKDVEYIVTYRQMIDAFQPIKQGIADTLGRIRQWSGQHGERIDRVIIVGGFGRFPLVRQVIMESLELGEGPFDGRFNSNKQVVHSVAAGAAVIANEKYQVVEKYPHTIGLDVNKIEEGMLTTVELPILQAGKYTLNSGIVWAARSGGSPELVEVTGEQLKIYVWIKRNGKEKIYLEIADRTPDAGNYHLGTMVDANYRAALIFKNADKGTATEVYLGDISIPILIK